MDKIEENYSDIRVVFSGKKGFHIHVHDFDVRDWTHDNEGNQIKSHEVAALAPSLDTLRARR
jgi:DNA primase catalytic subunit